MSTMRRLFEKFGFGTRAEDVCFDRVGNLYSGRAML